MRKVLIASAALIVLLGACNDDNGSGDGGGDAAVDTGSADSATDTGGGIEDTDVTEDTGAEDTDTEDTASPDTEDDVAPTDTTADVPPMDTSEDAPPMDTAPDIDVSDVEFGIAERPANPDCLAPPRPPSAAAIGVEPAFASLELDFPVAVVQAPGDDRWYLLEQRGRIRRFANDDATDTMETVLDITDRVACCGERGLLGIAFHPDFPDTPEVFLNYTRDDGGLRTRVARFAWSADVIDPDSEQIVIEVDQPASNHNGGSLAFGPDGYLYIGLGDGGGAGDPWLHGQDTDTLLGAMLRIDIDVAPAEGYAIPADNPFADGGGAPEIFAWGFRNPWKYSFDTETGLLWAGDVGQGELEEVDIVELGGNYGWSIREGTACYEGHPECDRTDLIDPVVEYDHGLGRSITGGYVYHGESIEGLDGTYLYGDYLSGRIWGVFYDEVTGESEDRILLDDAGVYISSFGQGHDGEMLIIAYNRNGEGVGHLLRIVPAGDPPPDVDFPELLSETGCVDPADPTRVSDALIPYDLNVPFWSDGARKARWFAVPDGTTIGVTDDGDLDLPNGSVTMKSFWLGGRLVETRLFVRHDDGGWAGYTYAWNEEQTDATLVPASGSTVEVGDQTWIFPSRGECLQCHTDAAGGTLGLEMLQLDGDLVYPGGLRANQVDTLAHIGLIDTDIRPGALPATDGDAPLDERARAYLHSNCASCHRPGGTGRGALDLRVQPAIGDTIMCDEPEFGVLGIEDARLVAPGAPERSILLNRVRRRDAHGMPPMASMLVDEDGADLLEEWISEMATCP